VSASQINRGEHWTPVEFKFDGRAVLRWLRALSRFTQAVLLTAALLLANITGIFLGQLAHATTGNMILFWDKVGSGNTPPAGWCFLTGYDGYFPRGASVSDTVANWGTTFAAPNGSGPYTPGVSVTVSQASDSTTTLNGSAQNTATFVAANLPSGSNPPVSITADDNGDTSNPELPAFTNLALIEYGAADVSGNCTGSGSGIPNIVPTGAIAMFDGTSLPTGWNTYSTATDKMIRIGSASCSSHCGSDSVSNTITVRGLTGDGTGTTPVSTFLGTNAVANNVHTHAPPAAMTCTAGCASPSGSSSCTRVGAAGTTGTSTSTFTCTAMGVNVDPPYVAPLLGQATTNTPTLSLDITAMFDNDPGSGWVVLSGGGAYSDQFIRPTTGTANLTSAGNATRPAETVTGATGAAITTSIKTLPLGSAAADTSDHTHTYTVTTSNASNSNIPPYFDIVVAQKVNFTLQTYRWYVDPCPSGTTTCGTDNDVSDPWPSGSLDLAAGEGIRVLPAAYKAPDAGAGTQLRLRVKILVSGVNLAANNVTFVLQYAKTNYADCVSDPASWTTLANSGGGGDWTYGINSVTDNSTIANPVLTSNINGLFSKSASPSSNPNAVGIGNTVEYDWLIQDVSAAGAAQYDFRPVQLNPDGTTTLLSYYGTATGTQGFSTTCPSLTTKPTTDQLLRGGEFFQTNAVSDADQGFEWAD
jgi:hypothetical protein